MKKKELLELLNAAPDSIDLHDASLEIFEWINNSLTFTIGIADWHYLINDLEGYLDDKKKPTLIKLRFDGVKKVNCCFADDFRFDCAMVYSCVMEDGLFKILLYDECDGVDGQIEFAYDSFYWDVIGQLSWEEHEQWCREHGTHKEWFEDEKD